MIGLGTLFKKNISNWEADNDPLAECLEGITSVRSPAGRREIRPRLYQDTCGRCGRTILTGERTEVFAEKEDVHRRFVVCSHCRPQTLKDGFLKL